VIWLTLDSIDWDPYDESFARAEDVMLDSDGDLALPDPKFDEQLFSEADVDALYADPVSVIDFERWINHNIDISSLAMVAQSEEEVISNLNKDPIIAHLFDCSALYEPACSGGALLERTQQGKVPMAAGVTYADDGNCKLFDTVERSIKEVGVYLSAVAAGETNGISPEVLSKIWRIPIEQAG